MNYKLAIAVVLATFVMTAQTAFANDNATRSGATASSSTPVIVEGITQTTLAQTAAMQAQLLRQLKDATLEELQQQLDPATVTVEMLKTANRVLFGTLHKLQNAL